MEPPPDLYGSNAQRRGGAGSNAGNQWTNNDWGADSWANEATAFANAGTTTTTSRNNMPQQQRQQQPQPNRSTTPQQMMYNNPQQQQQQDAYNPYAKMDGPQQQQNSLYPQMGGGGYDQTPWSPYQDTSTQFGMFPQQLMSDPVMNAAKAYGEQFAEQQKEKISRYLSADRLKFYFAVDNSYVAKKLGLVLFPFVHQDWSIKYTDSDEPVPPRMDVNSPDLYIPLMAVVTYIMVAGFVLGVQGSFSPEQLGLLTSNALAWLICENILILVTKYVMAISQALSIWHALAFSSYKFVGMIATLIGYLVGGRTFYYGCLLYVSIALAFYLIRSVKSFVLETPAAYMPDGTKRKLYLIAYIALSQPFVMWWLTSSIIMSYMPPAAYKMSPQGKVVPDFDKMSNEQIEQLMAKAPDVQGAT